MPHYEWLDSSAREEDPTIVIGKTILLKIIKNEKKRALLDDPLVKKFVSIPNLPAEKTRQLIDEIIQLETWLVAPKFLQTLVQNKDKLEQLTKTIAPFEKILAPLQDSMLFKGIKGDDRAVEEWTKKAMGNKELLSDFMFRIMGKLDAKTVSEYEQKILSLDKELKKNTSVSIVSASTLFLCPKCKVVLGINESVNTECFICNTNFSQDKMKRLPFFRVPDQIKSIWKSNLWFEAYFAGLLRRLGYKTWTGIHVMGSSGILHEIDVLAIRDGSLIVCECKTGKISRKEVFNFVTKSGDLKAHVSILALIGELPEPETRAFVKRNPAIIRLENMGRENEETIFDDLKNRLLLKT